MAFKGYYGVYHSNYDSFHWVEKFGDPNFHYHAALTQIWGILTLRLASQPILPFEPTEYAADLNSYVDWLTQSPSTLAEVATSVSKFPVLRRAIKEFRHEARTVTRKIRKLQHELDRHHHHHHCPRGKLDRRVRALNDRLFGFERGFIDPRGIPGREWYKHVVYAPGLWAGYAPQTFPSIADVLDAGNATEVARRERRVARFVRKAAEILDYRSDIELEDIVPEELEGLENIDD
jgi:N-acetylated-alpha-linked acidic dipeptidase